MITISEKAQTMLKQMGAGEEGFVRIRVKSGGCSGMTYDAEIDFTMQELDKVVCQDEDLTVVSTPESIEYLDGLCIDYSDDLISAGFRFNNASNASSCGCGASFSVTGFPELAVGGVSCDS